MKEIKYFNEFLAYLAENNYSTAAITSYSVGLKRFNIFLINKGLLIKSLKLSDINNYTNELKNNLSLETVNVYLNGVKNYFKYLQKNYNLKLNFDITQIKQIRRQRKAIKNINFKDIYEIFKTIKSGNTLSNKRDYLIIQLILKTGIRISELVRIKKDEISKYTLDNHLLKLINKFISKTNNKSEYFFTPLSYHIKNKKYENRHLTPRSIEIMIKKYFNGISYNDLKLSYYKQLINRLPDIKNINHHIENKRLISLKEIIKII
ncbi:MAG: site-specific integrase [Patescibacteria group bacterium]